MKFKKYFLFIIITLLIFLLASCGMASHSKDGDTGYSPFGPVISDEDIKSLIDGSYSLRISSEGTFFIHDKDSGAIGGFDGITDGKLSDFFQIQAGQITSAALSDHKYFKEWLEAINDNESELAKTYQSFVNSIQTLYADQMLKLTLTSNGLPLENADVHLFFGEAKAFSAKTMADGVTYLFGDLRNADDIKIVVNYNNQEVSFNLTELPEEMAITYDLSSITPIEKPKSLDLALVIDTTGSMGDELEYLKVELKDVLERVSTVCEDIRIALIFYRDEGDAYVTRTFDFTDNFTQVYKNLKAQESSGGGDYPEAVHKALNEAVNLSWRDDSTNLLIHVCDAPIHNTIDIKLSYAGSVKTLAAKGIRMIPVMCSGSDSLCETIFRIGALYTGGTYTYITNHSGIGLSHEEPTTTVDVTIEYLNQMLARLVKQYVTGEEIDPEPYFIDDILIINIILENSDEIYKSFIVSKSQDVTIKEIIDSKVTYEGEWFIYEGEELVSFDIDTKLTANIDLIFRGTINEVVASTDDPTEE